MGKPLDTVIKDSIEALGEMTKKVTEEIRKNAARQEKIDEMIGKYENDCNKEITKWGEYEKEDVKKELNYCTDVFMLMKVGDKIKCDCGDKIIPLEFDGEKVVYKDGAVSPSEKDIPKPVDLHMKNCFGTCMLEEPSRHPGTNAAGGNPCEPSIVGTSWLETYNNAKSGQLRTVLFEKSWLACKYMGRIMSADLVQEIDTAGMTEEEAFDWMLRWVKGEYIPQVILDEITHIYAGGDDGVNKFRKDYAYNGTVSYANMDNFDSKFLAWSRFTNNLWEGDEKSEHLNIRPIVIKAICMAESSLGNKGIFNATVNIMQSMAIGDGTLWHLVNCNPYPKIFNTSDANNKQYDNIYAQLNTEEVVNGYVQFVSEDYFYENGDRVFRLDSQHHFGKADIGEMGNPIIKESIKTVRTHNSFPQEQISEQHSQDSEREIIMVNYNQQSIDMSVYAACVLLANKGTTEKEAVGLYNYNDNKDAYASEIQKYLLDFGTNFIN